MLLRPTLRMIAAASFGIAAFVIGSCVVLALAAEDPRSYEPTGWLYVLGATALGAVVGAAEAPRIAAEDGLGVGRVAVVGAFAALVLFAVVLATETALGTPGVVDSLTAAQEAFAGGIGVGLVCGSVLFFPVILVWGWVGAVTFRWARRRFESRAVSRPAAGER